LEDEVSLLEQVEQSWEFLAKFFK